MTSINELSYLSKVRKFRQLAAKALEAYPIADPNFKLVRVAGNIVFRVYSPSCAKNSALGNPYEYGQYLLRIHDPGEQAADAVELEMRWLEAICEDTNVPAPQPVRNLDGNLTTSCMIPEIPGSRTCTILRWLKGRRISANIRPHHFHAQGQAMAQLHVHAAKWKPPKGLNKRHFDYNGLFKDNAGAKLANEAVWPLLPKKLFRPYTTIAQKTKLIMDTWGKGSDVYGLIHGDCGVDANVLFWKGNAHIIDFDGSGFGYYLYDLALALEHCWEDKNYGNYRDALLKGYSNFRSISDNQLIKMDLFRAAFYVYMGLWTIAMDQSYPNSPNKSARHAKWLKYGLRFITKCIN